MDIILIPLFGITGSAIATLIAQICSNIYLWHKARSIVNFHILRHLKKIAIAALVMAGVIYGIGASLPVVVTVIVGAGVYFAVLAAQREKLLKEILAILRPGV
jgi:O-antigen/teichoic acid export membrane protein